MGKRRRAREMALQMLYQAEVGESPLKEILEIFDLREYLAETAVPVEEPETAEAAFSEAAKFGQVEPEGPAKGGRKRKERVSSSSLGEAFSYAKQLLEGSRQNGEEIDTLIRQYAENWRLERMPVIDRNVLRIAVYEMLYQEAVPKVVIVDEAIELAKKFGSENSGRFVNGLLDGVLRTTKAAT